ncbi:hypothetical protein [Herbidospora cretacea]|uniref:hypothetical protein n=1 Tax=Herbidospora cretacea TaxID=28444 RepID=UPI000774912F|nr:hypothetical protein [Herbidospora cretacea]
MLAFYDQDESEFYGLCVADLLRSRPGMRRVHEFGAGSGHAMIDVIRRVGFRGMMHGFELDERSATSARELIARSGLAGRYQVCHGDFFADLDPGDDRECVVANPPYLPLLDDRPGFPHLSGGHSGSTISKRILSAGFGTVLLMISSYADPCSVLEHARDRGYVLTGWMVLPLKMGEFTRRPAVLRRINAMALAGTAFVAGDKYLLAGGVWDRAAEGSHDQSALLSHVMSSFGTDEADGVPGVIAAPEAG